ncbi:unnamed protein product [Amoebophrya sp. A120]|nr:unnamed protein product [Amoebophrya sp. A120]|eukprot:GSA120T00024617001.1
MSSFYLDRVVGYGPVGDPAACFSDAESGGGNRNKPESVVSTLSHLGISDRLPEGPPKYFFSVPRVSTLNRGKRIEDHVDAGVEDAKLLHQNKQGGPASAASTFAGGPTAQEEDVNDSVEGEIILEQKGYLQGHGVLVGAGGSSSSTSGGAGAANINKPGHNQQLPLHGRHFTRNLLQTDTSSEAAGYRVALLGQLLSPSSHQSGSHAQSKNTRSGGGPPSKKHINPKVPVLNQVANVGRNLREQVDALKNGTTNGGGFMNCNSPNATATTCNLGAAAACTSSYGKHDKIPISGSPHKMLGQRGEFRLQFQYLIPAAPPPVKAIATIHEFSPSYGGGDHHLLAAGGINSLRNDHRAGRSNKAVSSKRQESDFDNISDDDNIQVDPELKVSPVRLFPNQRALIEGGGVAGNTVSGVISAKVSGPDAMSQSLVDLRGGVGAASGGGSSPRRGADGKSNKMAPANKEKDGSTTTGAEPRQGEATDRYKSDGLAAATASALAGIVSMLDHDQQDGEDGDEAATSKGKKHNNNKQNENSSSGAKGGVVTTKPDQGEQETKQSRMVFGKRAPLPLPRRPPQPEINKQSQPTNDQHPEQQSSSLSGSSCKLPANMSTTSDFSINDSTAAGRGVLAKNRNNDASEVIARMSAEEIQQLLDQSEKNATGIESSTKMTSDELRLTRELIADSTLVTPADHLAQFRGGDTTSKNNPACFISVGTPVGALAVSQIDIGKYRRGTMSSTKNQTSTFGNNSDFSKYLESTAKNRDGTMSTLQANKMLKLNLNKTSPGKQDNINKMSGNINSTNKDSTMRSQTPTLSAATATTLNHPMMFSPESGARTQDELFQQQSSYLIDVNSHGKKGVSGAVRQPLAYAKEQLFLNISVPANQGNEHPTTGNNNNKSFGATMQPIWQNGSPNSLSPLRLRRRKNKSQSPKKSALAGDSIALDVIDAANTYEQVLQKRYVPQYGGVSPFRGAGRYGSITLYQKADENSTEKQEELFLDNVARLSLDDMIDSRDEISKIRKEIEGKRDWLSETATTIGDPNNAARTTGGAASSAHFSSTAGTFHQQLQEAGGPGREEEMGAGGRTTATTAGGGDAAAVHSGGLSVDKAEGDVEVLPLPAGEQIQETPGGEDNSQETHKQQSPVAGGNDNEHKPANANAAVDADAGGRGHDNPDHTLQQPAMNTTTSGDSLRQPRRLIEDELDSVIDDAFLVDGTKTTHSTTTLDTRAGGTLATTWISASSATGDENNHGAGGGAKK